MATKVLVYEDESEYIEVKSVSGGILIGSARNGDDQAYTGVVLDSEKVSDLIEFLQNELSKITINEILEQ